jgi:hypothetical protein
MPTTSRTPHQPPSPNNNQTIGERDAGRAMRANMDAKQAADREKERQVIEAHRTSGGGPKASSGVGRVLTQDGKINLGG